MTYSAINEDSNTSPPITRNTMPLNMGLVCLYTSENAATPTTLTAESNTAILENSTPIR